MFALKDKKRWSSAAPGGKQIGGGDGGNDKLQTREDAKASPVMSANGTILFWNPLLERV